MLEPMGKDHQMDKDTTAHLPAWEQRVVDGSKPLHWARYPTGQNQGPPGMTWIASTLKLSLRTSIVLCKMCKPMRNALRTFHDRLYLAQ